MMLTLNALEAGYGSKTVISNVSFSLEPGKILAFLGHNGAGKTTTLKSIMGLLRPASGEVLFDGHNIGRLSVADRVALGLRLLPEGRGIFPDLTVAENVAVVAARNVSAGAMFNISDIYRLFPVLEERRTTRAGRRKRQHSDDCPGRQRWRERRQRQHHNRAYRQSHRR